MIISFVKLTNLQSLEESEGKLFALGWPMDISKEDSLN